MPSILLYCCLLTSHVKTTAWLFFPSTCNLYVNKSYLKKTKCGVAFFYSRKDKMIIVEKNTETNIDVYISSQSYGKYQAFIDQPFFSLGILQVDWVFPQLSYYFSVCNLLCVFFLSIFEGAYINKYNLKN
jgi:hypothetical protein